MHAIHIIIHLYILHTTMYNVNIEYWLYTQSERRYTVIRIFLVYITLYILYIYTILHTYDIHTMDDISYPNNNYIP